MKNLCLIICAVIIAVLIARSANAQYAVAIGPQIGKFSSGINVKYFFDTNANTGIEIFGGYTREAKGGYMGRLMLVKQLPIFDSKLQIPVDMIFGAGVHTSYFNKDYFKIREGDPVYYGKSTVAIGIGGQFGLEYDSRKIPFTVGVQAIPFFSCVNPGPEWLDIALVLRYKFR
jgi:hypothetical protein